jgi:putative hemolysin
MKAIIGRVENCQIVRLRQYTLRLARTREKVEVALRLRFEVLNLEVQEGLRNLFHWNWTRTPK